MISLVMAVYNGEKYILQQLDSIKNQTLAPDEVIIHDDKSTDESVSIVVDYIKKNGLKWSIVVNNVNQGYSRNFSNLIKEARGDIVILADQDDVWLPDKIEKMTKVMEEHPEISLLASNVKPFYTGQNPQKVNFEKFDRRRELIPIRDKSKWIKPIRPGCAMCIRPSKFEGYDELWYDKYPHDCLLWGLSVLSNSAYLLNEETIEFRRHDSNTSSRGGRTSQNRIRIISQEIEYIQRMLNYQKKVGNSNLVDMLEKQLDVYKTRLGALEEKNVWKIFLLLPRIKYFGRNRFWLTDMYYCAKKRR